MANPSDAIDRGRLGLALGVLTAVLAVAAAHPARALEEPPSEWPALEACEKKLCTMVLDKKPAGDDLACKLSKTWASDTIKGGEKKSVKWGFGDARCTTAVAMSRAEVVAALTKPTHTVNLPKQAVRCEVEREGELKPLKAVASPRIDFANGKAEKIWINLEEIDGPADIKGTIWTAASLEDTLGIFHRNMIKQVNKFLTKKCWEKYGPGAAAYAAKEAKRAKAKAAKEAKAKAAAGPETKANSAADGKLHAPQEKPATDVKVKPATDTKDKASSGAKDKAVPVTAKPATNPQDK